MLLLLLLLKGDLKKLVHQAYRLLKQDTYYDKVDLFFRGRLKG